MAIELSQDAKDWLIDTGYDRAYGARPLARVIQEHIKRPLAAALLFGKLAKGGPVKVGVTDGKPSFEIVEGRPANIPPADKDQESDEELLAPAE